mgnify:CR=1 FL=1
MIEVLPKQARPVPGILKPGGNRGLLAGTKSGKTAIRTVIRVDMVIVSVV